MLAGHSAKVTAALGGTGRDADRHAWASPTRPGPPGPVAGQGIPTCAPTRGDRPDGIQGSPGTQTRDPRRRHPHPNEHDV